MKRRRFVRVCALAASLGPAAWRALASAEAPRAGWREARWQGVLLGTEGHITLFADRDRDWEHLHQRCLAEIARLEGIFSLYQPQSALVRLNREGRLERPPPELVEVLHACRRWWEASEGYFNPAVQPLWRLYGRGAGRDAPACPGPATLAEVAPLLDFGAVAIDDGALAFGRPGMALTLNGVAQGYITDRVATLLRAEGFAHVLVELGEFRALGPHPEGRPWRVGLRGAETVVELDGNALATSSPDALPGASGVGPHLFDPHLGKPVGGARQVSVAAADATTADALSTALCVAPPEVRARMFERFPASRVWIS